MLGGVGFREGDPKVLLKNPVCGLGGSAASFGGSCGGGGVWPGGAGVKLDVASVASGESPGEEMESCF